MKIAIAQLNPTVGDLTGNAQRILAAAQTVVAQGARLMLTPELSLCGYPPKDLLMHPQFIDAMAAALAQLAADLPPQLAVLVGTVVRNPRSPQTGGKSLLNSVALLENGVVRQIFHKRLLPTYDIFDEDRYFEPGEWSQYFTIRPFPDSLPPLESKPEQHGDDGEPVIIRPIPTFKIGVTICEDLWNDEEFWGHRNYPCNPVAELAEQGVDLIVNLSASPYQLGKQQLRESMLRHTAMRYQQPILYANQVGGNDDLIFDGNSVVLNRRGTVVARLRGFVDDLAIVKFDLTDQDLAAVTTDPIQSLPDCPEGELWAALVLGVQDYVRKCGFAKIVVGLSGGIDSALVAAIAAAAIGSDQVLGVLMPSPYSSDHSVQDALALAENLGIPTQVLPIGELMQAYDQSLEPLFTETQFGIAEENIQSRIRGNLLMAIANKFGHLLISTGNKSEMAVGYCTLYGDMNGGLAAISDVPKTMVYRLCHWLNHQSTATANLIPPLATRQPQSPIIPESILAKAPSAELKPDQKDQDSLPPYDVLDDILHRLIHKHESFETMVAAGHDPAVVTKVLQLVARAEFKRRQAPPGLKISDRAFGTGWRMPIASRWQWNTP